MIREAVIEKSVGITKIVIAGDWHSNIHEEPLANALESLGKQVVRFKWHEYFSTSDETSMVKKIRLKFEAYFSFGLSVRSINKSLLKTVENESPDLVFIYRPNLISKNTIESIKAFGRRTWVVSYNNDDPFSSLYPWYTWARYKRSIKSYDLLFSYRPNNVADYYAYGAKSVEMLPPWYVEELNYPIALSGSDVEKYSCDVVFIGHYEKDGRLSFLRKLVGSGVRVGLYGPGWNDAIKDDTVLGHLYPVRYLGSSEYNKALCGSKLALVLYSKLNNDVYTRRCFEIPATKTAMLAKRTKEMELIYSDGEEVIFFDDEDHAVGLVHDYLKDEERIKRIAHNGWRRAKSSGYEVKSRANQLLKDTLSLQGI
ncbi:MAG: hypothetical protein COB04_01290 [Gammaproteobacteria bacterium]|nr:MAG: hypothetical protein COB04_01290 [Gammaproteobacteria bacterium]